ncbi:class I SAM-dependent methyltransferase [Methylacidimicrobium tartarophylax]|uniref:Demethylmenaquinone methyltransferase n=1 Tax=Methylacidimicrobium tartarophylax TaxID=1041768 RepID=A0A5E6MF34_9BACT|nr:methyltransferase domain-containing protein [Methylacidimicrobium tartarophylax]VVM06976.1 Demethylmenaquinone methyltransferase [Methylacidimicrobium tartarophylax]
MTTQFDLDTRELAESYDRLSDAQFCFGKLLVDRLEIQTGQRVLDVGCGTGRLAEYVAQAVGPSGEVLGIDPLPFRIEIARKRARPGLSFEIGGSDDLGRFADRSWDVVCLNSVFHWIERKAEALREIHRILQPGGRLGIGTGDKDQPNPFHAIIKEAIASVMGQVPEGAQISPFLLSAEEVRELVLKAGFSALRVESTLHSDFVDRVDDLLDFFQASSFGNFLALVPEERQPAVTVRIREELEKLRTAHGIERRFQRLLVIGERKE